MLSLAAALRAALTVLRGSLVLLLVRHLGSPKTFKDFCVFGHFLIFALLVGWGGAVVGSDGTHDNVAMSMAKFAMPMASFAMDMAKCAMDMAKLCHGHDGGGGGGGGPGGGGPGVLVVGGVFSCLVTVL